jgi:SAM-dependent methyltransferase
VNADAIRRHYGRSDLLERLLTILREQGRDPDRLQPEDLIGIEDMHVGGREATRSLFELMPLQPGLRVLDVGCGLGGPARLLALMSGARVTAIDLTPELVVTARELTRRVGLSDHIGFAVANGLALPFSDRRFDGALSIHVSMNIEDKPRFYREIARVLKPSGVFALYDVLRGTGEPDYPVPWAESPEMSHLVDLESLERLLLAAGLAPVAIRDRSDFGRTWMRASAERAARPEAERLASARAVMGERFREKIANLVAALADGRLRLVELLARPRT